MTYGGTITDDRRPFASPDTRRGPVPDADKQAALAAYLHEHLSGADIAIRLVERLSRAETDDQPLFECLYHEFHGDHRIVRAILDTLGVSAASPKRLLARAPATVLSTCRA